MAHVGISSQSKRHHLEHESSHVQANIFEGDDDDHISSSMPEANIPAANSPQQRAGSNTRPQGAFN